MTSDETKPVEISEGSPAPAVALVARPEDVWRVLALVSDWVRHAEAKAALELTASGAVGAVLYTLLDGNLERGGGVKVTATLGALLLCLAGVLAGIALMPRLWNRQPASSDLYFHHIAKKFAKSGGSDAYATRISEVLADEAETVAQLAAQIWSNSHVASSKYQWTSGALASLLIAMACVALTAILKTVGGG